MAIETNPCVLKKGDFVKLVIDAVTDYEIEEVYQSNFSLTDECSYDLIQVLADGRRLKVLKKVQESQLRINR